MQCEKCGGTMLPKKLFRTSGCLVVAGVILLVASLASSGLGVLVGVVGPGAARDKVSTLDRQSKRKAMDSIQRIDGVSTAVVHELETTGRVSEATLSTLPLDQRQRVRTVLIDYYGERVSSGAAHGITAGVGTFVIVLMLAFGVPGTIVGLLLLRRRKVWRCQSCGFAFDRT